MSKIGPLVDNFENTYNILTLKDTKETVSQLSVVSFCLIYQETVMKLVPLAPLAMIMFIFYNYFYEKEFKRPKNTYIRNMKFIQAQMNFVGDMFDFQYYLIDNCLFWKSNEKTLMTLNMLLIAFLAVTPLWLVPLRYILVAGLWGVPISHSPFCMAVGQTVV